jgi:hypothetical protein
MILIVFCAVLPVLMAVLFIALIAPHKKKERR